MTEIRLGELCVPQLGEGLREVRIVKLLRQSGSRFNRGDPLYLIETDKTTVELEAPYDGVLVEWKVGADDVVAIGAAVASVSAEGVPDNKSHIPAAPERMIPPRTRSYAHERGVSDAVLATIPSSAQKLMPGDVDEYLKQSRTPVPFRTDSKEYAIEGNQRVLAFRLRRSSELVVPGTISVDLPWQALARRAGCGSRVPASAFQVFGHAIALVARNHRKFRSVLVSDSRVREYSHVNLGIAISRPDDELIFALIQGADLLDLEQYVRECRTQMRSAIRDNSLAEDAQILLSHLGKFDVRDAIPTLVAPATSIFFLGSPNPANGIARVTLTFDHRLINGEGAARFLRDLTMVLTATPRPA